MQSVENGRGSFFRTPSQNSRIFAFPSVGVCQLLSASSPFPFPLAATPTRISEKLRKSGFFE
ncbi:hypothetical protein C2E31_01735 [Rhodopirellula baltica]|nr:hypothetical protein C2E31_01735 [Rhodopirellula baltica]